jgi:hypothetical protein
MRGTSRQILVDTSTHVSHITARGKVTSRLKSNERIIKAASELQERAARSLQDSILNEQLQCKVKFRHCFSKQQE